MNGPVPWSLFCIVLVVAWFSTIQVFHDLMAYKRKANQSRLKALEDLSALDQELGFGY